MKKIGKKFNFMTKVLLVLGLLFSNLSCLTSVFAYEEDSKLLIGVVDNEITVKYLEELEVDEELVVKLGEVYTYLDGTYEEDFRVEDVSNELIVSDGYKFASSILDNVNFDGLYELRVELVNKNTGDTKEVNTYSGNVFFLEGLREKIYLEGSLEELMSVDDIYYINGNVDVKYSILSKGMAPSDKFKLEDGEVVSASELILREFTSKEIFDNNLYGEHTRGISIKVDKVIDDEGNTEEVLFSKDINYVYYNSEKDKAYFDNATELNNSAKGLELDKKYLFDANNKNGVLYITSLKSGGYSVNDLFNILDGYVRSGITYKISNSLTDDLEEEYMMYVSNLLEGEVALTREEYFNETLIDNQTEISITDGDITIVFKCIFMGDMNGDNVISEEDIEILINQLLTIDLENLDNGDLNKDGQLDSMDLFYLYQAYNGIWEIDEEELKKEGLISASLKNNEVDIENGKEFTVDYIIKVYGDDVKGIDGYVKYDEDKLELLEIVSNNAIGNSKDNRFIYLFNDSLVGTLKDSLEQDLVEYDPVEKVVLTLRFKAKASGSTIISIDDMMAIGSKYKYTNGVSASLEVIVNKSTDATLRNLLVNGNEIKLEDDKLKYYVTVNNEITELDVEAIVNNLAAEVTDIVIPEELVVGENEVKVLVTAEDGTELVYEIVVTREEKVEETTQINYQDTTVDNNDEKEDDVITLPDDKNDNDDDKDIDDEKEDDGSLSRIVIIILILLVIAGLIYLIFKDEKEDEEVKKANKEIDKYKKDREIGASSQKEKVDKPKNNTSKKNNNRKER